MLLVVLVLVSLGLGKKERDVCVCLADKQLGVLAVRRDTETPTTAAATAAYLIDLRWQAAGTHSH